VVPGEGGASSGELKKLRQFTEHPPWARRFTQALSFTPHTPARQILAHDALLTSQQCEVQRGEVTTASLLRAGILTQMGLTSESSFPKRDTTPVRRAIVFSPSLKQSASVKVSKLPCWRSFLPQLSAVNLLLQSKQFSLLNFSSH